MLKLSKKLLCALEAVVDIAYNAGVNPVQSKEITRRQGIPERYLEQVMQQLVHAGILKGVRGPRGGYRLARERRRITIGEIATVIYAGDTEEVASQSNSLLGQDVVGPLWQELQEEVMERLNGVTVEELCRRAREQGIESEVDKRMDFTI